MDPANDDHDDNDDDDDDDDDDDIDIGIDLYLISIEGVYGLLWQLYIQYISKLTLEIQILRVLANTPTGYGRTKKLDPQIKKKKHFQIAMKIFLSFRDLFVPCSVTTTCTFTTFNIIIKRRKRQDGSLT